MCHDGERNEKYHQQCEQTKKLMADSRSEDEWNHVSREKKLQSQESKAAEYLTETAVYLAAVGE